MNTRRIVAPTWIPPIAIGDGPVMQTVQPPPAYSEISVPLVRELETAKQNFASLADDVQAELSVIKDELSDVDTRLRVMDATTTNGTYLWRIPGILRRRSKAISGEVTSVYSSPFMTNKYGYKLCLRLYLNGDGRGSKTHFSLYLEVLQGEYDSLLKWPIHIHCTMELCNPRNSRDSITHKWTSDCIDEGTIRNCFSQPTTEANKGSGIPKFVLVDVLWSNKGFVVEDTIYIKCTVIDQNIQDFF